jgi:cell division septum initiation protein DivIVA
MATTEQIAEARGMKRKIEELEEEVKHGTHTELRISLNNRITASKFNSSC